MLIRSNGAVERELWAIHGAVRGWVRSGHGFTEIDLVYPAPGGGFNKEERQIAYCEYRNVTSADQDDGRRCACIDEFVADAVQQK